MTSFFTSLFSFIIAIAILIAFHEFGHFWVARRCGVKILRFSIGFGKPLLRWTDKRQTEYVIAAIPLGGYVKMLDEREQSVAIQERHLAFNRQVLWKRFLIVLAGPIFNFIFAILAYWLMFIIGITGFVPFIGEVSPHSIADKAGLQKGDKIVMIDESPVNTWQSVLTALMTHLGEEDTLIIKVKQEGGSTIQTRHLDLEGWTVLEQDPNVIATLGIKPYIPEILPILGTVFDNSPAEKADLKFGDEIIGMNGQTISDWLLLVKYIQTHPGEMLSLKLRRGNESLIRNVAVGNKKDKTGKIVGYIGVAVQSVEISSQYLTVQRYGVIKAFQKAVYKTKDYSVLTVKLLGKMIAGKVSVHNLSGPISIAQNAGEMVTIGFQYFLGFLALISISLGVLNLLPIPLLDGGHLFYYVIEAIFRKPVPEKVKDVGVKVGVILLIMLMGIAFYNDILRIVGP